MAALNQLNAEQALTLIFVFSTMSLGGILMIGRVALGMEG